MFNAVTKAEDELDFDTGGECPTSVTLVTLDKVTRMMLSDQNSLHFVGGVDFSERTKPTPEQVDKYLDTFLGEYKHRCENAWQYTSD